MLWSCVRVQSWIMSQLTRGDRVLQRFTGPLKDECGIGDSFSSLFSTISGEYAFVGCVLCSYSC